MNWIELVGYLGSFLVLISFLMTSVAKLRIVNTVGSVIFAIYALIIHSYPTALMNICLVAINLHFLWKMRTNKRNYEFLELPADDGYVRFLLDSYAADIEEIFPKTLKKAADSNVAYVSLHEKAPAGFALGTLEGSELTLGLDYSLPAYRDFSLGEFLYRRLAERGVETVYYRGPGRNHGEYLARMGFVKQSDCYVKDLTGSAE